MEGTWLAYVLIALVLAFLISGMYIGAALGVASAIILFVVAPKQLTMLPEIAWTSTNIDTYTAVVMFILMGELFTVGGLSDDIFASLATLGRKIRGVLAYASVLSCTVFAAISGSSVATAAAIGKVAAPQMTRRGYDRSLTYGCLAAGGTLGILIPPSLTMILYGTMVGESIGKLFIAGIIPGLILSLTFMATLFLLSKMKPSVFPEIRREAEGSQPRVPVLPALVRLVPAIVIIVLVIGFIYAGVTTATEAGAMGAGLALVYCIVRKGSWRNMIESAKSTARTTSMILFIVLGAQILTYAFSYLGAGEALSRFIGGLPVPPVVILAMFLVLYGIMGCFLDAISMLVITVPVIYPVIMGLGYNSIHFAVLLTLTMELGLITPPVGMNLFVLQGISDEKDFSMVVKGATPFALAFFAIIVVIVAFPSLSLWLPSLVKGR